MATAATLKNLKIAISLQWSDRFQPNLAWRRSFALSYRENFKNLEIQDGGGRHLEKKSKIRHIQRRFDEI